MDGSLLAILDVNEAMFSDVLDGVSDDDFIRRLNSRANSMQWVAGHLAHTRCQMARLADEPVEADLSIFSSPLDSSITYPGRRQILAAWSGASAALREALQADEVDLAAPAPMRFPISDRSAGGALAFFAQHEAYHLGQLGLLRRAFGYPAVVYGGTGERPEL